MDEEEKWVNPNQPHTYYFEIWSYYCDTSSEGRSRYDLAELKPNEELREFEQYSLPGVKILDVGDGWVRVNMWGERVLHWGESFSTGTYEYMPYSRGCRVIGVHAYNDNEEE